MTTKYIGSFAAFLAIVLLGIGDCAEEVNLWQSVSAKQDEIVAVSYCDLVKNQVKYGGKLVRVKATVLTWQDGTSLYDAGCEHEGVEPILDCDNPEECFAMRKTLEAKADNNGYVERVEAVLVGRFIGPLNTSKGEHHSQLKIKTIEDAKQISRDVPWPGGRD